jgi:hypothetical protein
MTLADRVARRFIARSAPRVEFFSDEMDTALDTLKGLHAYGKALLKARALMRPVAECLRSKALGKVYVDLTGAIDTIPALQKDLEGVITDLQRVDHELLVESRRHAAILREAAEDYTIDETDVRLPTAALKALQARIKRYHAAVEKTFDEASFSIDEIGTAGSLDLKAYERLMEKLPGWEELNIAEIEVDGLEDAVASRALDDI